MSDELFCTAHLERAGQKVPAYKLGLCRDCFSGKHIRPSERIDGDDEAVVLQRKREDMRKYRSRLKAKGQQAGA